MAKPSNPDLCTLAEYLCSVGCHCRRTSCVSARSSSTQPAPTAAMLHGAQNGEGAAVLLVMATSWAVLVWPSEHV